MMKSGIIPIRKKIRCKKSFNLNDKKDFKIKRGIDLALDKKNSELNSFIRMILTMRTKAQAQKTSLQNFS